MRSRRASNLTPATQWGDEAAPCRAPRRVESRGVVPIWAALRLAGRGARDIVQGDTPMPKRGWHVACEPYTAGLLGRSRTAPLHD